MIEGEKALSPSEFVLRDSYESRHLFRRDIAAIDFARVYFLDMVPIDCVCGISYIRGKPTWVNIGFRALTLASHAIFAARGVLVRYHGMTTIGDGIGEIGEKHLKSVCSSGTHRKSCVPLLASFHMLLLCLFFFLSSLFCSLSAVSFFR